MSNPFDIDLQRERIDNHKAERMADQYRRYAIENNRDPVTLLQFWIEQIGDAELYYQRWVELKASALWHEMAEALLWSESCDIAGGCGCPVCKVAEKLRAIGADA